jgi:hypothetical protein
MYGSIKLGCRSVLLIGAVALGGCTSLLHGKQYAFPQPGEPSATVRLQYGPGMELQAMTFSDSGCYAGYTPLPYSNGFIESPVAAGKKLVLTYWQQLGGQVCKIPFSFVPEDGATYLMHSTYAAPTKIKVLSLFEAEQQNCGLVVMKKTGDKAVVEPVKKIRIDTGFACLRFNEETP